MPIVEYKYDTYQSIEYILEVVHTAHTDFEPDTEVLEFSLPEAHGLPVIFASHPEQSWKVSPYKKL